MSEPQPDQIDNYNQVLRAGYTFYPGNTMGYDAAPQSVAWRDSDWEFVWGNTVSMPFMRESRRQPIVRLRHRSSGQEVYWVNAHLSPGNMQDDRDKGMAIISAIVKELDADGLPVLVTGDLNEHGKAFRKIACPNVMKAAVGGTSTAKKCVVPKAMRVDWVFGKRGTWSNTTVDKGALVSRTTDHAVVSSRFTVG
jgi:endonuclease/exonuclease/phosphatase family metal-dependent hydrolase